MLLPLESQPRLITAPSAHFSVGESYAFCSDLARSHYENFPVASLLLPRRKRHHIHAIYAFARVADDFADQPGRSPAERLDLLDDWHQQLMHCYDGDAEHPVFIALRETVQELHLPVELFLSLLAAFRQDVTTNRYESFEDVLSYCRNSANPIGRLVLHVFGYVDPELFALSDSICTALQLTNFWQDISIDRENDRLYLPLQDLSSFQYSVDQWREGVENDSFRKLMQFQVERTARLFVSGAALPRYVKGRLSYELRFILLGGREILRQIERMEYGVHSSRPKLGGRARMTLLFQALTGVDGGAPVTPALAVR